MKLAYLKTTFGCKVCTIGKIAIEVCKEIKVVEDALERVGSFVTWMIGL
jgi:hypothetical protein